jgi:hypothetical protein
MMTLSVQLGGGAAEEDKEPVHQRHAFQDIPKQRCSRKVRCNYSVCTAAYRRLASRLNRISLLRTCFLSLART